jgi:single-strand DNA-binding protein
MTATPNIVTIVGNITADPILNSLQNGTKVVNVSVGSTSGYFDKASNAWVEEAPVFYRVAVWRKDAENLAATAKKGTRVVIIAKAKTNTYESKGGDTINAIEYDALEVAVSLSYATAVVARNPRDDNQSSNQTAPHQNEQVAPQAQQSAPVQQAAPVAAAASADDFS